MTSIKKLMLREHQRLNTFLDILEKELNDYKKTLKNFNKFKWNLEKHFFVEEKAITDTFIMISGEETSDTFHLLEDHVKIIQLLKILEKRLTKKIKPEIHILKNKLNLHKNFEEQDFYPKLDKRLNPKQKRQISKRIKEVVLG